MLVDGSLPSGRWSGGGANPQNPLFDAAEIQLSAIIARRNAIHERIEAIKARHAALAQNADQISKPNEPMMDTVCALEDENKSLRLEMNWVENEIQALDEDLAVLQQILAVLGALPS
ncbi:hypothetical protein N7528_004432 [Penicillium herquei]|nr:hypothetical protein N7528_004432 [Penicillium herquei]